MKNSMNAVRAKATSIVWFCSNLRVHDNKCLNSATNESMSVLTLYYFNPRDYDKSSSGFNKTGLYRVAFLIESVSGIGKNLQAKWSDLVVRVGKPEIILVELTTAIGADIVYAHREVSHNEVKAEEKIEAAIKDEGVELGRRRERIPASKLGCTMGTELARKLLINEQN
ncbi:blue-light photoreceptor PHR2-like [Cornus florida]|uniref:blue-light photoreceptor PHR2-like n=1 Tax=Cornus florida TaxID=4283 RepID=UPI002896CE3D|nr:blue-light photoreceptor PHR2-like [Cornus florida]